MIQTFFQYIKTMQLTDIIDILIVAFLIYKIANYIRRTNVKNLAKGIIILLVVLAVAEIFDLKMIDYVLRKALELGTIALVVLFQPELRRALERVGAVLVTGKTSTGSVMENAISQIVLSCSEMSASKTGALIVFERENRLNDVINTGTVVNSDVVAELVKNIFYNKAPLHDGAMIIRNGRIAAAGCVLPLTKKLNLSKELGMRHRAGLGLSEASDAIIVIVSEETGAISVAIDGMLKRHLSSQSLEKILSGALIGEEETPDNSFAGKIEALKKRFLVNNSNDEE